MLLNGQDFLEPQDVLKDFIEVKDTKPNHNLEHRNGFNQPNYWQLILYSVVVSTFADIVLRSPFVLKKYKK